MTLKLLNLVALSSLAIFASTFGATPANASGLNPAGTLVARSHANHARSLANNTTRRSLSKRCAPRPVPSVSSSYVAPPAATSSAAAAANAGSDPNAGSSTSSSVDTWYSSSAPAWAPSSSPAGGWSAASSAAAGGWSASSAAGGWSASSAAGGWTASSAAGGWSASAPAYTPSSAANSPAPSSGSSSSGGGGGGNGGNGGGGKIGLAWALGDDPSLSNFVNPHVSVIYTWSPTIPSQAQSLGLEGIPMLWGSNQISQFQSLVVQGYASTVLGFNEPNEPGQSNLDPWTAASLWQQYIQPLKELGYKLVSPACSSNPNGVTWTQNFISACTGCTLDAIAVHWYDVSGDAFIAYIENYHNLFGLPIWVTEFACQNFNGGAQCTQDYIYQFMGQVTQYMDNADWVEYYFAFGVMTDMQGVNTDNQLMTDSGYPTPLGYEYLNAENN